MEMSHNCGNDCFAGKYWRRNLIVVKMLLNTWNNKMGSLIMFKTQFQNLSQLLIPNIVLLI